MTNIKIIEVKFKQDVVLKAIEVAYSCESVSPCCTKIYHRFYCQNKIVEESWYNKIDASGKAIYNKKTIILNDYIIIPEFDKILEAVKDMNFSKLNY